MEPLVTLIIPTYNSEKTLSNALESIASQTFKNVEVIIIDGNSADNTLVIADSFKEKIKILTIVSEKDEGIYDAMNKGIEKACGSWLYFMGSDDLLYDSQVLKNITKTLLATTAKVVYGNVKIIGDTGWAKDGEIYAGEFTPQKLLNQNICHQAIFYEKEFIKNEIGFFNLKYKKSSDWDFNLRCWAKTPFQFVDMLISNFTAGGFSSHSNDTAIVADFVDNVRNYFKIDLFHPWLNSPTFEYYGFVKKKQQEEHPIRFKCEQLKNKFKNKLRKLFT